ncbi:MAG: hypothetical protein IJC99_07105 [Clostridia bacterium]|nr:hypothetical protein [Clostridia bacterium]
MNYQEKVSTRADVRALYEKVKANPAVARYRGYTESKSYGWDEEREDYVKCEGEVWFENPAYDASFVTVGEAAGADAELLDEQLLARDAEITALTQERDAVRAELAALGEELAAAIAARAAAEEKCDTVCGILTGLKAVLETVLAYENA